MGFGSKVLDVIGLRLHEHERRAHRQDYRVQDAHEYVELGAVGLEHLRCVLRSTPMMPPAAPKAVRHPLLDALDRAPVGEPFTPEERAELDVRAEELLSGRVVGVRDVILVIDAGTLAINVLHIYRARR